MNASDSILLFRLDERSYAVPLEIVERVVLAVDVIPLPGAPRVVLGIIDIAGDLVPVLSVRRRLGLVEREIGLHDHFLIARSGLRRVALLIDEAVDVSAYPEDALSGDFGVIKSLEHISGITKLPCGLVLIYDMERCLGTEEGYALDTALLEAADT